MCSMNTTLPPESVAHLARLARLTITSEELERFAGQLSSVISYVEQLSNVDTSAVGELQGVTGLSTVLAPDELRASDDLCQADKETWLSAAPGRDGDFIQVRAVLGDEVVSA